MRARTPLTVLLILALAACSKDSSTVRRSPTEPALASDAMFPDVIALPNGFAPAGIAFGRGSTFYAASFFTGSIFRGDASTGSGDVLVASAPGGFASGIRFDPHRNRLFVAGALSGQLDVYDASSGATLAVYQLADPADGKTCLNDLVIQDDAVYITDDARPVIYRVPLGPNGELPPANAGQTIPLTGDFQFVPGVNANGIVATPDSKQLIVVNTWTGILYRVDPTTGRATAIDLGGGSLSWGDGLVLFGHTLYVVQGPFNQIAVVQLRSDFSRGTIERVLTNANLAFPSAIAAFGNSLYTGNAHLDVVPGPSVAYQVVRVSR